MNLNVIYQLARIKPLAAWSLSAVMIGIAVSIHEVNFGGVNWLFVLMGGCIAILLQYVSHPLNDIMDYVVDKATNIKGTGRVKVLISGLTTTTELWFMSAFILYVVLILTGILWVYRPLTPLFVFLGLFAVIGYNINPFKLAYRPFFEWYAIIPVNIGMIVALVYVATGELSSLAVAAGVVHAFAAVTPYITSRSMDFRVDRQFGKLHTVAKYPYELWCTLFPAIGIAITSFLVMTVNMKIFAASLFFFVLLFILGVAADMYRWDALKHSNFEAFTFDEHTAVIRQVQFILCLGNGIVLSMGFLLF